MNYCKKDCEGQSIYKNKTKTKKQWIQPTIPDFNTFLQNTSEIYLPVKVSEMNHNYLFFLQEYLIYK